jgi:hypothetical protein
MVWKNPFKYTREEKAMSDAYIRKSNKVRHLLAPHQQKFYDLYTKNDESGLYCSRKTGKTFTTILIAIEACLKEPNVIVRYAMSTLKTAKEVLLPILEEIRTIIPDEYYPKITVSDMTAKFKNGSQIKICGSNKEAAESARGPRANLVICDEVPSWDLYAEYMITGILIPQGTTIKNFKIIYAGTPPDSMEGYFIQSIYPKLISRKVLVSIDIDENPLLTEAMIQRIVDFYPLGRDDPNFRREHKLELIPNNTHRLTPEFNESSHVFTEVKDKCVEYGVQRIPQLYQCFISADTATVDNTAILCGYFDHHNQKLVVETEFVKNNINLTEIANELHFAKDNYLKYSFEGEKNLKIIIDAFALERKEFREIHGIQHISPLKGKVEDNIAHLRSAFENNKIEIHGSCERLIWELNNCVWKISINENKQIERNSTQKHGDAIMALTYMLRAVNWRYRPDNAGYNIKLDGYNPKVNKLEDMKARTSRPWGELR